jgi:hypothetical protein
VIGPKGLLFAGAEGFLEVVDYLLGYGDRQQLGNPFTRQIAGAKFRIYLGRGMAFCNGTIALEHEYPVRDRIEQRLRLSFRGSR